MARQARKLLEQKEKETKKVESDEDEPV